MKRLRWQWALLSTTRWRAYCKACGWEGKPRRRQLGAYEESFGHWCPMAGDAGREGWRVPSYDKGIQTLS